MRNNKTKMILFAIFVLALLLRLLAVITQEESQRIPHSDASGYDRMAVSIASGEGFVSYGIGSGKGPTLYRTPMYPLFLAGIYAVFGHNYMAVKIIQAILGAFLCVIIFFIANTLYEDRRLAIIASAIVAIYKPFIWGFNYYGTSGLLLTEPFYTFIASLAMLTLLFFVKKDNKGAGVLSGILMGLTILTRPEFVVFPIILGLYLFYISQASVKKFVKKYFFMYLFIILTMIPWVTRNYIVSGEFIPLTNFGGAAFWLGNCAAAKGGMAGVTDPNCYYNRVYAMDNVSEQEKSKILFKKALEELRDNPRRIPLLIIKKILVLWAPFEEGFKLFNPYYAAILLFAFIGWLFFKNGSLMENILIIGFLSITVTAIILFGDPRYRYPFEPYLIIFAALTVNKTFALIERRVRGAG